MFLTKILNPGSFGSSNPSFTGVKMTSKVKVKVKVKMKMRMRLGRFRKCFDWGPRACECGVDAQREDRGKGVGKVLGFCTNYFEG